MIINNLLNIQVQKIIKKLIYIKKKKKYNIKKKKIKIINIKFKNIFFLNKNKFLIKLTKKYYLIKKFLNKIKFLKKNIYDNIELLYIYNNTKDIEVINYIKKNIIKINNIIKNLENTCIFIGKNDKLNCYLNIKSGTGGIESQDWCNILLKMYLKWAEKKKFKIKFIKESIGNINGIKSVTIKIIGNYAYGWLRTEIGIHRLVRKNLFNKKRHTSFSSVFVYPIIKKNININIKKKDLRIDCYKSSGSGGQHINKTESAVRITHLPTNFITQCQKTRSQYKNKINAIKKLNIKLLNYKTKKTEEKKKNISWGNQIRSYVLDDSFIKDIRTNLKINNIKYVLNGNLDFIIKKNLKAELQNDY
ncbi:MAG: PCRF domain-containing protein [Enterobacteriaceae bacterium PSpyr]|nr:MAG: PCRF domain-containing protein [Enterobacteriaceae bacterium PSpyr]